MSETNNKEQLRDMLDNLIDQKPEQAQVAFHSFLQGKIQSVLNGMRGEQPAQNDSDKE